MEWCGGAAALSHRVTLVYHRGDRMSSVYDRFWKFFYLFFSSNIRRRMKGKEEGLSYSCSPGMGFEDSTIQMELYAR